MALTPAARLRSMLGERIPTGGTAADTMFSDEEVDDFIEQAGGDLDLAALRGWEAKAAEYANLVTTSEGNSARHMSDLHKYAQSRVEYYSSKTVRTTPTVSHQIVREGY